MNYHIDQASSQPAYLQLYDQLRKDIELGVYPYGSRLPSKRTIASETGISVITAEHAMVMLCDEGYAEPRQRSGCYAAYRASDFNSVAAASKAPAVEGSMQLASSPAEFPFSVLSKTMRKVMLDYGERILVKSPNHGSTELRNEISSYLARSRGITVSPSQVIIGSGAEYLYGLIAQLLGTDRTYALEDPSYDKIRKVYESFGVSCEMLKLHGDGISTMALGSTRATVLHVTPFNSFPSGITVGISKKREYIHWAKERCGFIVEDNFDSELTVSRKPEDSLFAMADGANVIYINTFSKTIAPSMRVGYMLLPENMVPKFNEVLGFYSCTVPLFEQFVLAELLRSGDFERNINRVRRKRRRALSGK